MVGKVHIVEIMGRDAGWLTASPDVLPENNRPHLFYLPENKFDLDQFLADVKAVYEREGYAMICISEGLQIPRDMSNVRVDGFGHAQLGGAATELCHIVEDKLNLPTRAVELSLTQRACPVFVSKVDREEAIKTGEIAVRTALNGETGKMIVFKRTSNKPYMISFELEDLSKVANAVSLIPQSMMKDATRMDESFREYIRPLINGEVQLKYKDGIALVTNFKYIKVK
jgi:6-phosphofructokinase 1